MITLKQYIEIVNLQKKHKGDNDALGVELIKLISGKDIKQVTLEEAEAVLSSVNKELEISAKELPLVHRFKIDGVEFGFIPNLEDITVGEFIDLDALLKQDELQLEQIMSVLYRPIKKKSWWSKTYSIESYTGAEKYNEAFLKTDCRIVLGAIFFFALLKRSLLNHIATYTPQMMKSPQKEVVL